ncbi:hypothetical protein [uncultured Vagococcus sp.]|uniref:hypothetical protein n=1 Tax=uncultured Vagococcus sp. TaxID=189676 RepID=UPI0028D48B8E|nr:hypothetical protein [uncultured Vagococcus sp.]
MGMFDLFKKKESLVAIDYQKELAKIISVYEKYPVFPYIPYEEGIEEWIKEMVKHPDLMIGEEYLTPNEDGLLQGELKLLEWIKGCSCQVTEFPAYFERTYGINPVTKTEELLVDDYLDIDESINNLFYWPLTELNELLEEHHLLPGNSIAEAISVIKLNFSEEFIDDLTHPGIYVLMPKGQEMLAKYVLQ